MSVEKNGEEIAAEATLPKGLDSPTEAPKTEEAMEESKIEQATIAVEEEQSASAMIDVAIPGVVEAKESEMRQWFKGLGSEELWETLGFEDGAYLEALLTNPSWSLGDEKEMEWTSRMPLKYLESAFSKMGEEEKCVQAEHAKNCHVLAEDAEPLVAISVDGGFDTETDFVSDAMIIRGDSENETSADSSGLPASVDNSGYLSQSLPAFLDEVCMILPSARKLPISAENDILPFVSVQPAYLDKTTSKEILQDLDVLAKASFGGDFLAEVLECDDPTSPSWLMRLVRHHGLESSIPLYMVLVARLESAAMDSFLRSSRHHLPLAEVGDNFSPEESVRCEEKKCAGDEALVESLNLSSVLSRYRYYEDLSGCLNAAELTFIERPLEDVFFPRSRKQEQGSLELSGFFFVGLSRVLRSKMQTSTLDVARLDGALRSTLQLIEDARPQHVDEVEESQEVEDVGTSGVASVGDESATGTEEKVLVGQKKKKKKNKKRKNRKSIGAETLPDLVLESALYPVEGSSSSMVSSETPQVVTTEVPTIEGQLHSKNIASSQSTESDDTEATTVGSTSPETVVDNGNQSVDEEKICTADDFSVAPVSGADDVVVCETLGSGSTPPETNEVAAVEEDPKELALDDDEWNTVEVRGRASRKKGSDRYTHSSNRGSYYSSSSGNTGSGDSQHGSKKAKGARTAASRRRLANRKMVRDILNGIVDGIEDEASRKKQGVSLPRPVTNAWVTGPPGSKSSTRRPDVPLSPPAVRAVSTLRDIVLGTHVAVAKSSAEPAPCPEKRGAKSKPRDSPRKGQEALLKSAGQRSKVQVGNAADQNTAPTYTETVSAVSTISNAAAESKEFAVTSSMDNGISKSDSVSDDTDTDEIPEKKERVASMPINQDLALTPPLPTLLSPENANSATSSVASSLEVPMAGHRHHHHSNSAVNVNDVGYHLLDVCDRLSRDMNLFMSRRALALSARRRERGALLGALQVSVSRLWPERCHVEMYGSCATQLDLPSSDLDVVVLGLDHNVLMTPVPPSMPRSQSLGKEGIRPSQLLQENSVTDETNMSPPPPLQQHVTVAPFVPMIQRNAERVARLAAELEVQPWAVHINAITTAAVPVIKVLADPSRIEGFTTSGDWAVHRQHLEVQAAAVTGTSLDADAEQHQPFSSQPTLLPWRGADVMNGLLSLDITFEGPEHGGIGSTEYSMRTVAEVCHETGLQPDATPFVQVVMVLKEILAQRKLNEPYSGGLSSYALLLLVIALLRERAVIREEIERSEWQRQAMSSSDSDPGFASTHIFSPARQNETKPSNGDFREKEKTNDSAQASGTRGGLHEKSAKDFSQKLSGKKSKFSKRSVAKVTEDTKDASAPEATPHLRTVSSWASIAKKNSPTPLSTMQAEVKAPPEPKSSRNGQKKGAKGNQKATFADALTGSAEPLKEQDSLDPESARQEDGTSFRKGKAMVSGMPSTAEGVLTAKLGSSANIPRNVTPSSSVDASLVATPAFFPHAYNDVIEVLCSGEPTAGKLLMHFLLYYGEHFNSQNAAIDISGKHERDYSPQSPFSYCSPFIQRSAPPNIDPFTGMLSVDQIVIYDPLEGAEDKNVARRCFAWPSVRWLFAQSYATLSSAVERSATPPTTPSGRVIAAPPATETVDGEAGTASLHKRETVGDLNDPSSPLLRCLLSF